MDINGKKQTHLKGLLGELEFILYLARKGWNIYRPLDQNSRVDLVLEKNGTFRRVQIKYCTPYKGCLRIELDRPMRKTPPYGLKEIDEIGAFDSINRNFYLIPLKKILPRKEMWLRVDKLAKTQKRNINWGHKFKI